MRWHELALFHTNMLKGGSVAAEIEVPKRRAMLDPVLSDVPPSTDVTLTPLPCNSHDGAMISVNGNIYAPVLKVILIDCLLPAEWLQQHINGQTLPSCCILSMHRSAWKKKEGLKKDNTWMFDKEQNGDHTTLWINMYMIQRKILIQNMAYPYSKLCRNESSLTHTGMLTNAYTCILHVIMLQQMLKASLASC